MRYDPNNMLAWAIIPNEMSGSKQLKYFDYICRTELNPLSEVGVAGPDGHVKVNKLFGRSLDLPERKGKILQSDFRWRILWLFHVHRSL